MKKILYLILFLGISSFASTLGSENIPMKVGQVWKLSSVSMMDEVMPRIIRFLVDEIRGTQGGTAIIYGHHEFSRQNPIIAEYILDTHLLLVIEQKTTRKPRAFGIINK